MIRRDEHGVPLPDATYADGTTTWNLEAMAELRRLAKIGALVARPTRFVSREQLDEQRRQLDAELAKGQPVASPTFYDMLQEQHEMLAVAMARIAALEMHLREHTHVSYGPHGSKTEKATLP